VNLAGLLVLPVSPQFKREIELDRPWTGTIDGAAAAVPAFLRMKDDGRLALHRMRDIHVNLACFHAGIAPGTNIRIEDYRIVWCRNVGKRKYFFL
jgi:hypothetical protein